MRTLILLIIVLGSFGMGYQSGFIDGKIQTIDKVNARYLVIEREKYDTKMNGNVTTSMLENENYLTDRKSSVNTDHLEMFRQVSKRAIEISTKDSLLKDPIIIALRKQMKEGDTLYVRSYNGEKVELFRQ